VTDRRVLGVEAAAAYLDTSPRTIQRLIARGVLTPVSIPTLKRVLIAREDLDRLIDTGKLVEKQPDGSMAPDAMEMESHVEG
jgi:excisionase family DNA binding protein